MMAKAHFNQALFDFLRELKENNTRQWFQANTERYERDVRDPMLRFIVDFASPLQQISGYFVADPRPNGGSHFRIHRDISRFTEDEVCSRDFMDRFTQACRSRAPLVQFLTVAVGLPW